MQTDIDPQRLGLRAGCAIIHEEHASGANRTRPALAPLLATIRSGETLVVIRLELLACLLNHLLQVIETLGARTRSPVARQSRRHH